jgi:serine-type D-Ala-D-Ala carboxypeptidase/endopeptidase (penicillin-binding protein 4)
MKSFLIILFVGISIFPQNLDEAFNRLANSPALNNGIWGVYANYTDNGEEIISRYSSLNLAPASVLKVVISSSAFRILGEEHRFKTEIYFGDSISSGTIYGNVYIVGGGDPTFGSNLVQGSQSLDQIMNSIAASLKSKGIERITGSIIGDDHLYPGNPVPDYYPYIDLGNYYAAGSNALTINDNLYHLYFKPSNQVGGEAAVLRTEPVIPDLTFENFMRTGAEGSGDNGYIYNSPGSFNAVLRGTIPAGVAEFSIRGSIPDPPLFAAQYLTRKLFENNIAVDGNPSKSNQRRLYDEFKLLYSHLSPPLKDIAVIVNKRSNNLYTELLLRAIGEKIEGDGTISNGIKAVLRDLKKNNINTESVRLFDGSGLSHTNRITPKTVADVLTMMTREQTFEAFYNSLSVAGDPSDIGFFRNFGANTIIARNVRIKSGTINGVRCHAGYVRSSSGRLIAFCFMANSFTGRASAINEVHVQALIQLAGLK